MAAGLPGPADPPVWISLRLDPGPEDAPPEQFTLVTFRPWRRMSCPRRSGTR